jgi:release factor glutamine methyltransferase
VDSQLATDIRSVLRDAIARLDAACVDAPTTTARLLLAQALGQTREWLVAHGELALDTQTRQHFQTRLDRVIAHEPLAYVLGRREFYGLDLIVDRRVLVPRPETEMLVEFALDSLSHGEWAGVTRSADLIDIGTGSGAVPIAVAVNAPSARIVATDISADALAVARLNAERHGVSERISFVQADLLEGIDGLPAIITANLPYVTREEIEGLPPEIQAHEPRVALDGGEDGLDLVRRLLEEIASAAAHRCGPPVAFIEIGASQGPAAIEAARAILPWAHSEISKDLAGLDRILVVRAL